MVILEGALMTIFYVLLLGFNAHAQHSRPLLDFLDGIYLEILAEWIAYRDVSWISREYDIP